MIKTRKYIILSTLLFTTLSHHKTICVTDTTSPQQHFEVNLEKHEKPSRKKRMRKSHKKENTEAQQKKIRTYMDMEYEQLVEAKNTQKAHGNTSATIKYLEQLLKITTDITQLADHLLELADTFFLDKQYQKSSFIYNQYCALYPGTEKQEYALYKGIMSSFACILSIERDQTKTEETLSLAEYFLKQELFTTYKEEVETIRTQCQQHLAASEQSICTYYLNRGSLKAAEKRLSKIRSFWLPKLPTLEPDIIALETQLKEKKEAQELLLNKNMQLTHHSKAKHMTDRF